MVRLSKDGASRPEPDREALARVADRAAEASRSIKDMHDNLLLGFLPGVRMIAASFADALARVRTSGRRARWARQYPLYTCPWHPSPVWNQAGYAPVPACGRTWDRRTLSTEELRMEVWDHLTSVHMPGEAGLTVAGRVVAEILEGP